MVQRVRDKQTEGNMEERSEIEKKRQSEAHKFGQRNKRGREGKQ